MVGASAVFVEMGLKQYSWSIDSWRKYKQKRKLKDCTGRTSLGSFPKIEVVRPQISGASGPKFEQNTIRMVQLSQRQEEYPKHLKPRLRLEEFGAAHAWRL